MYCSHTHLVLPVYTTHTLVVVNDTAWLVLHCGDIVSLLIASASTTPYLHWVCGLIVGCRQHMDIFLVPVLQCQDRATAVGCRLANTEFLCPQQLGYLTTRCTQLSIDLVGQNTTTVLTQAGLVINLKCPSRLLIIAVLNLLLPVDLNYVFNVQIMETLLQLCLFATRVNIQQT